MAELICLSQIMLHGRQVLNNSGHFLLQFGNFNDCITTEGFNYNYVELGVGNVNTGLFMGLCLPKQCTSKIIKQSLGKLFQQLHVPYSIYNVQSNIQDFNPSYAPLFFFTIILISFLVVLSLVISFVNPKYGFLNSFSFQKTLPIFKYKSSQLNIFSGIRSLCMMWVILGHTFLNSLGGIQNTFSLADIFQKPFILLVSGGLISVDVFFFIGGFFMAFAFMRQKNRSCLVYPLAVLQRALRIWPAYLITILFFYSVLPHLGSGPKWAPLAQSVETCKTMWRPLLFVDNLINNGEEMCLQWGWYLQVDFQIFIVCLILLYIYSKNKISSMIISAILIIGSWTYNIFYTQTNKTKLFTDPSSFLTFISYFTDIYIKPYARWTTYILGTFYGLLYFQYKQSFRNQDKNKGIVRKCHLLRQVMMRNKIIRWVSQWVGICIMAFVVFVPRMLQVGYKWDQIWHSLYFCFGKILFLLGLTLTITPTLLGIKGSFFATILDTKLFNIIAKISFCVYLVHYMVITQFLAVFSVDMYYYLPDRYVNLLGLIVVSCFIGFCLTIFVQIPFSLLQKKLLGMLKGKSLKKKQESNEKSKALRDQILPLNQSMQESIQKQGISTQSQSE